MKKFFGFLLLALVFLSIGAITINYIPGANSWVQGWLPGAPDGSSEELPEETPVYNIGDHNRHIFEAINDEIILTVTLVPSDASDQTLVWTSSAPTSVSVTAATALTAKIKCLADFDGNVTITVTATNGTTDTSDDVSATCVCTFYHPITSFTLGLSIDDDVTDAASVAAGGFLSDRIVNTNTQIVTPNSVNMFKFNVTILPANATYQQFTLVNDGGVGTGGDTWENMFEGNPLSYGSAFSLDGYSSAIGNPFTFTATSEDGIHSDTLTIQVGQEIVQSNKSVYEPSIKFNSGAWQTVDDLQFRFLDEGQPQNPIAVGTTITFVFPALTSYKSPELTVTVSSTYFAYVSKTSGIVAVTGGYTIDTSTAQTLVLTAAASTGSTYPEYINVQPTLYSASFGFDIPFVLASMVTGISVDHTTVTF